MDYITLSQLAGVIKLAVTQNTDEYWVAAELSEVRVQPHSGHCYLGLIEKDDENKKVAELRATIWGRVYARLAEEFRSGAGKDLAPGMKVLLKCRPTFHEVFGLSLNVTGMDPRYTLGDAELRRRETIARLEGEGLTRRNKALPLAPVVQRLAVISSPTAAGLGDFVDMLRGSPYRFTVRLYQAYMQGERAVESILAALQRCTTESAAEAPFDALVIIRGGGAASDLDCFDSYELARGLALAPIPVLAGIGHERDLTVVDHVAHTRLITPTAVAEFLIGRARGFEAALDEHAWRISRRCETLIARQKGAVGLMEQSLVTSARAYIEGRRFELHEAASGYRHAALAALGRAARALEGLATSMPHHIRAMLGRALTRLDTLGAPIPYRARAALGQSRAALEGLEGRLQRATLAALVPHASALQRQALMLETGAVAALRREARLLDSHEGKTELLDPIKVLRRGYSITTLGGRALRSATRCRAGDIIETRLYEGGLISTVTDNKEGTDNG